MKTTLLTLSAAMAILTGCSGGPGTGGSSEPERIVATADIQKEGIDYFEVATASSREQVVTAFDSKGNVVFSVDSVSNAAHTQKTITVTGPHVFHTSTVSETPAPAPSSSLGVRLQMSKECGYYYRELVVAFVTSSWDDFSFWADSISAFCGAPLVG